MRLKLATKNRVEPPKKDKVTSENSKYDSLNSQLSMTLTTLAQLRTTESWLSSKAILQMLQLVPESAK
jgi:hypothetical protein